MFEAKPLFETPNDLNLDPGNYTLVTGRRIGYNFAGQSCGTRSTDSTESPDLEAQSPTGPLELWEYLASLRAPKEKPRPTFYFPEHDAGPDLVFALEPINPTTDKVSERILCVVQLKTAGSHVNFQKAIMTTDLSQAYWNKSPQRRLQRRCSDFSIRYDPGTQPDAMPGKTKLHQDAMEQELRKWKDRTVIRILIATGGGGVSSEDMHAVKQNRNGVNLLQGAVNPLRDHFVMFGKARLQNNSQSGNQDADACVGDLFGDDFMSLLEQLKSKDAKSVIAARATPEEAEAKKEKKNAERRKRDEQDVLEGGFDDLFARTSDEQSASSDEQSAGSENLYD